MMERLTKKENIKSTTGEEIVVCKPNKTECNDSCMYGWCKWVDKAVRKLKEYEDLEEQGVFLRLPCKVEDTLYIIEPRFYNYEKHEGVQKGICKGYELNDRYGWVVKVELEKGEKHTLYFYNFSEFGKTVFLTREEAEQKLKEMENGKD